MLRTLAAGVVLFGSGVAGAETRLHDGRHREGPDPVPGLRFAEASRGTHLDRVDLALESGPADVRAIATLTVSVDNKDQDAQLEMSVPAGAQITYLGITIDGERRIAHTEAQVEARQRYEDIVAGRDDPALLEMVSTAGGADNLRLRVFPLSAGKPARVEVIMTLPPSARLVIDPGRRSIPEVAVSVDGARTAWTGVASARAVKLPDVATPGAVAAEVDDKLTETTSWFIDRPQWTESPRERLTRARLERQQEREFKLRRPRGAFRIAKECLDNPLAPSCM